MPDVDRKFELSDFVSYRQAADGYCGSLRVAAAHLATTVADASDDGWECLAVAPYRLRTGDGESTVEEYIVLFWKDK
jgi:hypothetical protein